MEVLLIDAATGVTHAVDIGMDEKPDRLKLEASEAFGYSDGVEEEDVHLSVGGKAVCGDEPLCSHADVEPGCLVHVTLCPDRHLDAVHRGEKKLWQVPLWVTTRDEILRAVRDMGEVSDWLEDAHTTVKGDQELVNAAVRLKGDREIVLAAVKKDGASLLHAPAGDVQQLLDALSRGDTELAQQLLVNRLGSMQAEATPSLDMLGAPLLGHAASGAGTGQPEDPTPTPADAAAHLASLREELGEPDVLLGAADAAIEDIYAIMGTPSPGSRRPSDVPPGQPASTGSGSGAARHALVASFEGLAATAGKEAEALYVLQSLAGMPGPGDSPETLAKGFSEKVVARLGEVASHLPLCTVGSMDEHAAWTLQDFARLAGVDELAIASLWRVASALHVDYKGKDPAGVFLETFFQNYRFHFEGVQPTADASRVDWVLRYARCVMLNHWKLFRHLLPATRESHHFETSFFAAVLKTLAQRIASAVIEQGADHFLVHLDSLIRFEDCLKEIPVIRGPGLLARVLSDDLAEAWIESEREYFNSVLLGCLEPSVLWTHHTPFELLACDEAKASRGAVQLSMALESLCANLQKCQLSGKHAEMFAAAIIRPCILRVVESVGRESIPFTPPPRSHAHLAHPLLPRIVALNTIAFLQSRLEEWELLPVFCSTTIHLASPDLQAKMDDAVARLVDKVSAYCFDPASQGMRSAVPEGRGAAGEGGAKAGVGASAETGDAAPAVDKETAAKGIQLSAGRMHRAFGYIRYHAAREEHVEAIEGAALQCLQQFVSSQLEAGGDGGAVTAAASHALSHISRSISGARSVAYAFAGAGQ